MKDQIYQVENQENTTLDDLSAAAAAAQDPAANAATGEDSPGIVVSEEVAKKLLEFPFALASTRYGDHWKLTGPELEIMKQPAAKLLTRYAGAVSEKYPDVVVLSMSLIVAVSARVAMTAAAQKTISQQEEADHESNEKTTPGKEVNGYAYPG